MAGLYKTDFSFEGQTGFYRGKVRDVYYFGDLMAVVTTDRISAFDVVLPRPIPFKGQTLNQISAAFLDMSKPIAPVWLLASPHPMVSIGQRCQPLPVEMVVRGYIVGHAWREYAANKRTICGVSLPDGLSENDKLPQPIITPTTKAAEGHDLDISRDEILKQGLATPAQYEAMERIALNLFDMGTKYAAKQGLILADTKYEFGINSEGQITLIDEIHTPDSSRYFYAETYATNQELKLPQKQLSKEFVRKQLIAMGFMGQEGAEPPYFSNEFVSEISERYQELFYTLLGKKLDTSAEVSEEQLAEDIRKSIEQTIKTLI